MAVQRIQISNNKRINSVKIQKQKISQILAEHKDEKARIQVEHIIRDDFTIEGYEVLELLCELVHERIRQLTVAKQCPEDLKEAVSSLIWAAKNVEIEELKQVGQQFTQKFGKEFAKAAIENTNGEVNARLYAKLVYKPPSSHLVVKYLEEIARAYNVDWIAPIEEEINPDAPFASPSGSSIPMAPGSGFASAYAPTLATTHPNQRYPAMTTDEEKEYEQSLRLKTAPSSLMLVAAPAAAESSVRAATAGYGIPAVPRDAPGSSNVSNNNNNSGSNNNNESGGGGCAAAPMSPTPSAPPHVVDLAPAPEPFVAPPAAKPAATPAAPEDSLAALQARLAALNK